MKTSKLTLILIAVCSFGLLTGCSTFNKAIELSTTPLSTQTTSQIIITAEKAADIVDDAMTTYVKMESEHHESILLLSSKPFEFAEKLRGDMNNNGTQDGLDAEVTLRTAIKAAKKNRTAADARANLITAYYTVKALIDDCRKYTGVATKAIK